ncbi:MAG TPA: tRNA-uridine aminocarboxypropyltransferase [Kofleriaceae bacterium]|nr:tRNA-uridine aminocarboxypropyltransferase [Kofleriaceae bacterium]
MSTRPPTVTAPARRPMCARCRRPEVVCYCAHLPHLPTRTRVLVLQHPREEWVGIGTARMAHLALPSSTLRVGVDFALDPVVVEALAGTTPSYLLFPGRDAVDVRSIASEAASEGAAGAPVNLVLLDGTWAQARTLLRLNPAIGALPRIAFTPARPSDYRIRRQPAEFCVSTIEALAEVLTILEPDGGPFERLLDPFRAMVARQQWFETEVRTGRHRRPPGSPRRKPARPTLATRLAADWPRLVCIQGESNGWPIDHATRPPPETVHFVACRPATGETYEIVLAARNGLAPLTPRHLELPEERMRDGASLDAWRRSWEAFARPDDVVVQWGAFHAELACAEGLAMPQRRIDLRAEMAQAIGRRAGTVEACAARLNAQPVPVALPGRGGRRLAALVSLVHALRPAP